MEIIIFDYTNVKQEIEMKDKTMTLYFKETTILIIKVNKIDMNSEIIWKFSSSWQTHLQN